MAQTHSSHRATPATNIESAVDTIASLPQSPSPVPRRTGTPVVLHVRVVRGSGGGPDKTILRTAQYADPTRYNIHAAYICPKGDEAFSAIRDQAAALGCPLWEVHESGAMDPRTLRYLLQLCRKLKVTVWHGHDYKSNLFGLMLRKLHPMALVTTAHGWTHESVRTRLYYHVDNLCLPRYDHVMTVSPLLSEHCRSLGVPAKRLTYLPNGIESQQFVRQRTTSDAKAALGMPADQLVLGCVGRLSSEKGVDRAIDTLAAVRQQGCNVALHLVGDGPQRETLAQQAAMLGVADQVIFHGWQRDARRLYEAMDALLLPSHTEGLPNVVLEAMAMGVPVAATNVGAVADVLDDGACGVILDKADTSNWAMAIEALLRRDARAQRIVQAARARVESHFDFQRRVAAELDVYDRVLDRPALSLATNAEQTEATRRAA